MVPLPERARSALERLVKDLSVQETVSGVGLFGSWSRGDAVPSSDLDLLVVDRRDFEYEYVERLEFEGILMDLDYVPRKWITGSVPPELDQKLHEVGVLYDRDGSLAHTKDWMAKTYRTPDRVDIRSEAWLVESDMYLSRASSAQARGDPQSACVFAGLGMGSILKIPIEVSQLPISNTHFIEALQESAERVGMPGLLDGYLTAARLSGVDEAEAERKLELFRAASKDIASFMGDNPAAIESLHFKVKTRLRYYGKSAFLRGMVDRSKALIEAGTATEAAHYLLQALIDEVENYAWLASSVAGARLDYTTLFRSLRGLKEAPASVYKNAAEALRLEGATPEEAVEAVKAAKETNFKLRRQRKALISKFVKPPA